MTELMLAWFTQYGAVLLFVVTFSSCLAVPVPSSLLMLTGGGFVASGDLSFVTITAAALLGGVLGDQAGYVIGHRAQNWLSSTLKTRPKAMALRQKAIDLTLKYGGLGVFLSRWLFSPLGPYVNFASAITHLSWIRFTFWSVMGEALWVIIYVGLGYLFASRITEVAEILGNASGFLAAGVITIGLGLWLRKSLTKSAA